MYDLKKVYVSAYCLPYTCIRISVVGFFTFYFNYFLLFGLLTSMMQYLNVHYLNLTNLIGIYGEKSGWR